MTEDVIHKELTGSIISSAIRVLSKLKPGLDEKIYENALVIELLKRGHRIEQQKEFRVHYEEKLVGRLIPDLIVDDKVIVDPKVVVAFNEYHIAQMTGYLAITGLPLALLLNFKYTKLQIKRVIRSASADSASSAV